MALVAQLFRILSRYFEGDVIANGGLPISQKDFERILPLVDLTTDNIVDMTFDGLVSLAPRYHKLSIVLTVPFFDRM